MSIGYLIPLWLAPVLQAALVLVIWKRREFFLPRFWAFLRYSVFGVIAGVLTPATLPHLLWYFWVYWIAALIYGVLGLLVMREIFQSVFDTRRGPKRWLFWSLMLALAMAATVWGLNHPDRGDGRFAVYTASIDAFTAGVHGVDILLFVVALFMVKRFDQYQIGILVGFAPSAIIDVLSYVGHFHPSSPAFRLVVDYAPVSAYIAAIAIWLIMFLTKPKVGGKFDPDAARELLLQQTGMLHEIATGLGLGPPNKKGKRRSGGTTMGQPTPRRV